MLEADPLRRAASVARLQIGHAHEFGRRIEQRDMHSGAATGDSAQHQRLLDADQGVHAGADIAQRHADAAPLAGRAAHRDQPRLGLDQQIVGLHVPQAPVLAIAADVAGHQARVPRPQFGGAKAHAPRGAGSQVLDEHVGARDHALKQREIGRRLEVQRDRFLAAVDPDEVGGLAVDRAVVAACEIAFGSLDLDDTRARVGQAAGAVGRGDRLLHRDDQQAFERLG